VQKNRQADFADLSSILEIEQSAFPPNRWATEAALRNRLALFPTGTWLALSHSTPVAFANGFPIRDLKSQEELNSPDEILFNVDGPVWYLRNLAVRKEFQKQGFGKLLVQRQIILAKQFGARSFRFTAASDVTLFYSSLGFTQIFAPREFHGVPQSVWNLELSGVDTKNL
jgi:GNAT superfamily N-acetyltransferase